MEICYTAIDNYHIKGELGNVYGEVTKGFSHISQVMLDFIVFVCKPFFFFLPSSMFYYHS